MASIGATSNLDVHGIVSQLMQIERRPLQAIERTISGIQTEISAWGKMQSSLSSFQDAARALMRSDTWGAAKASSSDESTLVATARSGAIEGNYSIEVSRLAGRQTLASGAFADGSAVVGSGTLRIRMGSLDAAGTAFTPDAARPEVAISIAEGATLADVRSAINAAGAGITASLVADGTGQRLMLRSAESGAQQAFRVDVDDTDGNGGDAAGLSAFAFDPSGAAGTGRNLMLTESAQDALVKVNGLDVTASGNRLEGVVENVVIEVRRETTAPIDITVASDPTALRASVDAFVKCYNELNKVLADQTRYEPATKFAGPLQGNQLAVRVHQQLRELMRTTIGDPPANSLSALGIELQRDGSLAVNDTRIAAALASPEKMEQFFAAIGATSEDNGLARRIVDRVSDLLAPDGTLPNATESLKARERSAEQQQERVEARLYDIERRLMRQYTALDANLSRITSSFAGIEGLLANMNKSQD